MLKKKSKVVDRIRRNKLKQDILSSSYDVLEFFKEKELKILRDPFVNNEVLFSVYYKELSIPLGKWVQSLCGR